MNRKLLLLDAVLVLVAIYAGTQFRNLYREAQARAAAERRVKLAPAPPPPVPATPAAPPVMATTYAKIAQNLLLSKDRNPVVPIEVPPPPPPPPPMPPLPVYHGMMDFGDAEGPFAIMSLANAKAHKAVHPGETIGEFKLLAVNREGLDLEWNNQKIHKTAEELIDRSHGRGGGQDSTASQASPVGNVVGPPRPEPPPPAARGPGDQAGDVRRCVENDTTPAGTVTDGYRKIVQPGPFGQRCYWEPVGKN